MFLTNIIGSTLFVHTHEINGVKVVHSHPFTSNSHNHSVNQIIALHFSTDISGEITESAYSIEADISFSDIIREHTTEYISAVLSDLHTLRAPPCC